MVFRPRVASWDTEVVFRDTSILSDLHRNHGSFSQPSGFPSVEGLGENGQKIGTSGEGKESDSWMIFAMFLRCILISFLSSLVHFSSVFRIFMRSCISPWIERTSIRTACLLTMNSFLIYFLTTGTPRAQPYFLCLPMINSIFLRGQIHPAKANHYGLPANPLKKWGVIQIVPIPAVSQISRMSRSDPARATRVVCLDDGTDVESRFHDSHETDDGMHDHREMD